MSTINLKSKMPDKNPPRKNHKFKRHNIKSKLDEDSIIIYAKEIILIDPDEDYEKKHIIVYLSVFEWVEII